MENKPAAKIAKHKVNITNGGLLAAKPMRFFIHLHSNMAAALNYENNRQRKIRKRSGESKTTVKQGQTSKIETLGIHVHSLDRPCDRLLSSKTNKFTKKYSLQE